MAKRIELKKKIEGDNLLPAEKLNMRFREFLDLEAGSGILLIIFAGLSLLWKNIAPEAYDSVFLKPLSQMFGLENGFQVGHWNDAHTKFNLLFAFDITLKTFINDVLMVFFFFVVGSEIKREVIRGELSSFAKASLPVMAALGGMIVPAGIYLMFHSGTMYQAGWGVPMATDIAFAIGVLSLLGKRIKTSLKIMLLAVAIADDLGAIMVIAIGYTSHLSLPWLFSAIASVGVIIMFQRLGVRRVWIYFILGGFVWFTIFQSGVHATLAGVILGFLTPSDPWDKEDRFLDHAAGWLRHYEEAHRKGASAHEKGVILSGLNWARQGAISPMDRLEMMMAPWAANLIIPLFALANAGILLDFDKMTGPMQMVPVAITAGLVLGKPLGVFFFSWLAVKLRISKLPEGMRWLDVLGLGLLAGIGFTMAIFVAELAFKSKETIAALSAAKAGIMVASVIAALAGTAFLWFSTRQSGNEGETAKE